MMTNKGIMTSGVIDGTPNIWRNATKKSMRKRGIRSIIIRQWIREGKLPRLRLKATNTTVRKVTMMSRVASKATTTIRWRELRQKEEEEPAKKSC
ncbi:hypothetical protein Pyn_03433 [Prunus yedoensis var. nudiflora]|uniref:Uncharacterized protein n=1 Tax=Prunus yedoensis var. nudiflora TaxID=2094558 RepID=A0A314YUY5_PRUYE|nr:hypothetical protein Pyn_03433 [Prunus yedoensis var. nudiflora]